MNSHPAMIPVFPPTWAEVFGEDRFGIFAEFSVKETCFVWRWIPPGRFLMGSPDSEQGRYDDEKQHEVTISEGFWMGETPVTQEQWSAVNNANPSYFKGSQHPIESVDWNQAMRFAQQLSKIHPSLAIQLPTEEQWEYACRAGTESAFNDGSACKKPTGRDSSLEKLGWFDANSKGKTHPVKEKQPNAWGLYDMHGNVWEWCYDHMIDDHDRRDDNNAKRVLRGGSWSDRARDCRSAYRVGGRPGFRFQFLGLRLAAGQEPVAAEPPGAERPQ